MHHVQTHALSAADLALESLIGERVRSRRHSRGSTSPITCGDLPRDYPPDASYDADCATVRFDVIDNWEEVCAQASEPPLGSTFDDLVTYVEGSPTIVAENVMVDGYRGMHLRGDGCGSIIRGHAPVAQWIERRPPEPKVAGSNPVGRARTHVLFGVGWGTRSDQGVRSLQLMGDGWSRS